jgi:hypothetical protein
LWKKKKAKVHGIQVDMHDKEYYERLVYEKAKKYDVKDNDRRRDRGDRGDDAKYREGWWSDESTGHRVLERIKLPRNIASKKLTSGNKVLHRKTKRIKIYGAILTSSELTDRDKIFNNARCNKNITKLKRTLR